MTAAPIRGPAGAALTFLARRMGGLLRGDKPTPQAVLAPRKPVTMLAARAFVWDLFFADSKGAIKLALSPFPNRHVGMFVDVDGEAVGLRLDRAEVQDLRHALTAWLCRTSEAVR
jgi:hypothetical protein